MVFVIEQPSSSPSTEPPLTLFWLRLCRATQRIRQPQPRFRPHPKKINMLGSEVAPLTHSRLPHNPVQGPMKHSSILPPTATGPPITRDSSSITSTSTLVSFRYKGIRLYSGVTVRNKVQENRTHTQKSDTNPSKFLVTRSLPSSFTP